MTTEGWLLDDGGERLTKTRYADDIMLHAKSLPELVRMPALLSEELAQVGLQLNTKRTKIMTNDAHRLDHDAVCLVDTVWGHVGDPAQHECAQVSG